MSEMFAVVANAPGDPEVLRFSQHYPAPLPGKSEIRVRVAAAGINPIDCARRSGYGRRAMKLLGAAKFPLVLGSDFVGVVEMIGPAVSNLQTGQWIFGCKSVSSCGTHAEYATLPVAQALPLPDVLSKEEAATLPYSFVTAYRLITAGLGWKPADCPGRRAMVHGGLGAVGSLAACMLAYWGAEVDISDHSPPQDSWRQVGAVNGFDLSAEPQEGLIGKYDAILNCAQFQNEETLFPFLRRQGSYATIVHPLIGLIDQLGWLRGGWAARTTWQRQADSVRQSGGGSYRWVLFRPDPEAFARLATMAASGILKPRVAAEYDVREAAAAHRRMAAGGLQGKIILRMS